jgi:raffinose/stachyose/melibiose transport system substrate-binding protein
VKRFREIFKTYLPLIVIGLVLLWSSIAIVLYRKAEAPPEAIIIRIGHWQLEASVREMFDEMAEKYRKINPNVYIVQDAIPDVVFAQWATTQLMGGTAPDLLQVGQMIPPHLMVQYYNRYFIRLTPYVNAPNPYNQETHLVNVPLRSTFKDGMRSSYVEEMQEYMSIPLSQFGIRVFYNRDLLRRLTGLDEAPTEYRAFLDVCEKIKQQTDPQGERYVPIASSRYHVAMWEDMLVNPLTYGVNRVADFNRDGFVGNNELYTAFKTGRIDFHHPSIRLRFQMLGEITEHFQTGFTGLTRDEAVFLFAQQRAVFMTTGTWDARSLQELADGNFDIGVMDFPRPLRSDPVYGGVVEGPQYERVTGGFPFAIARTSKHPEVALDFLLFLAGQRQNEELNRVVGWIPSVVGTEIDPMLKAFEPHLKGVYPNFNIYLGGDTWVRWLQLYSQFQIHQIDYDQLAGEYEPFYIEQGLKDLEEQNRDWRRGMVNNEQFLAGIRAKALRTGGADAKSIWMKYRTLTSSRQIWPEIERARQEQLLQLLPEANPVGPYEYGPEVQRNIRDGLNREPRGLIPGATDTVEDTARRS